MKKGQQQLMTDSFEIQGIWFLPGKDLETEGIKGTLKYSPGSICLELLDTFEENLILNEDQNNLRPLILGFSCQGEWLSLYECYRTKTHIRIPGFDTESYIINKFYVGTQLVEDETQPLFERCSFSLTYLDAWSTVNIMERITEKETYKSTIIINPKIASGQKKILSSETENICFAEEIYWQQTFPKNYLQSETFQLIFNRFYNFYRKDKSYFNFICCNENINKLRYLLVMLLGNPVYFTYIDIYLHTVQSNLPTPIISNQEQKCRLFYNQVGDITKDRKISRNNPSSILINRRDILNHIETIFCNWLKKYEQLAEVVYPYICDLYLNQYVETKFLNTVRSLETYYRFFMTEQQKHTQTINREKQLLLEFIEKNICEEQRSYFIQRINYEDEKSLRKKLKAILTASPFGLLSQLFKNTTSKEYNKIINSIVDTRNYFTHRDSKSKYPYTLEGHSLYLLTNKLNILLHYHILVLIGVPAETVQRRICEFSKFKSSFE